MATICPHANYDPLGPQTEPRMTAHDIVCLHTMAGTFAGVDSMFHQDGYGGTESHFGVRGDGLVKQWQDLDYQADANLDGNPRCISIETADMGETFPPWSGSDVPPWTDDQLDAIVDVVGWCCDHYQIPRQLVPDSKPGRRGIGYHRQGIDHWRVAGGERWSSATGKVCPGDRRIAQLTDIVIPRLQGATTPVHLFEENEMQMIRRRSDSYTMLLAGGKLFKVTGPDNWAEAEKGGTPRIVLDDDEYNRLVDHLGPVLA